MLVIGSFTNTNTDITDTTNVLLMYRMGLKKSWRTIMRMPLKMSLVQRVKKRNRKRKNVLAKHQNI
jgi:hypothetical protein